jgi:phospholipase C
MTIVSRCAVRLSAAPVAMFVAISVSSVIALSACAAPIARSSAAAVPPVAAAMGARGAADTASGGKIQHVVVVIQENRSFDNLFAGYPGADTVAIGRGLHGMKIPLQPIPFEAPYDIVHGLGSFLFSYNGGKMNGFTMERTSGHPGGYPHPQYGYVPASESQLYFQIAQQYVLADRMFPSNLDGSFVSHQFAIAGQGRSTVNYPTFWWGCDGGYRSLVTTITQQRTIGPRVRACFDYKTVPDLLMARGLTWRAYGQHPDAPGGGNWMPFQAVKHIWYSPTAMTNVITPASQILQDVPAGKLANVTWVTPNFANSDHPGVGSASGGPNWVASIINAIGESPFWNSTVIFVFWDDWGGWYDHVPPPQVDYDGLGIRVPMLCVSAYAGKGVVSHVQYETGSILKFIEGTFGLPPLADSDRRATSAGFGCLLEANPRPFVPFQTSLKPDYFIQQRHADRAADDD